jgi:excinuclease ABC subunit C
LQETPIVIECFDISHLSGTKTVASMVQFRNGLPDKSNYRRFKLSIEGNDDFASIYEVVKRRYSRLVKENSSLPNLVVIDGGAGQLHYALKALAELKIQIPIISLAKEFEEVYLPEKETPLQFGEKNKARLLLQQIRDEAHRFAISYNRLLRKNSLFKE